MNEVTSERILARQTASVRELNMEELKMVAGGGHSTGGMMCDQGWSNTQYTMCLESGSWWYTDPCDMTVEQSD